MIPLDGQPYVGRNAFTHKGGIHVDAVVKHASTMSMPIPKKWAINVVSWFRSYPARAVFYPRPGKKKSN